MRVLINSDFRAHSALFFQLKILDIFKLNEFHVAKFMFCYDHQILPPLFSNLFLFNRQVHNYYTGSSDDYRSHNCRTNKKIHCSLSRSFFMEFFAYLYYQFRNPILFQEKSFKLSVEPLLTFVKINYPIADHKSIILTQNYHEAS